PRRAGRQRARLPDGPIPKVQRGGAQSALDVTCPRHGASDQAVRQPEFLRRGSFAESDLMQALDHCPLRLSSINVFASILFPSSVTSPTLSSRRMPVCCLRSLSCRVSRMILSLTLRSRVW